MVSTGSHYIAGLGGEICSGTEGFYLTASIPCRQLFVTVVYVCIYEPFSFVFRSSRAASAAPYKFIELSLIVYVICSVQI